MAGSGTITTDSAMEATNDATNDVIRNVQSITSMLHLPSWFGRLLFIVITILVMLCLVRIVNHAFRRTKDAMLASGNTDVTLLSFARYVARCRYLLYRRCGRRVEHSGRFRLSDSPAGIRQHCRVVVGFAAQDTLGNVAGGVMILFFKPFIIGDFVRYVDSNVSGVIEEITLRHTAIRTPENKRIIIPNGTINSAVIENANYADKRICELFNVGITYESDMEKAIQLLRDEVMRQPLHLDVRTPEEKLTQPEVKVEVVELADSAVILRAWLWAADQTDATALKFALNRSVKNRFDAENIEFAYPHITITK